jgi:hypothetical protein
MTRRDFFASGAVPAADACDWRQWLPALPGVPRWPLVASIATVIYLAARRDVRECVARAHEIVTESRKICGE